MKIRVNIGNRLRNIGLLFSLSGMLFFCTGSTASAAFGIPISRLNVKYTQPIINFGPLSLGLSALPTEVNAVFLLGEGTNLEGPIVYDEDDLFSARISFGDAVSTVMEEISLRVETNRLVSSLSYRFSAIDTSTSSGIILMNFPLTITGTDIASGNDFSYTYATSTQTITEIPEPSTLSTLCLAGLIATRRRRR